MRERERLERRLAVIAVVAAWGCSTDMRRDQWYGTDVGLIYVPPEISAFADAAVGGGSDASRDAGGDRPDGGTAAVGASCAACEQEHISRGDCEPTAGCESLSGTDKDLCVALLTCMRATGCWKDDPMKCLCGTASGVACTSSAANGPCRAQVQAATKTTDPVQNGVLLYNPSVPSGRATQLILCDMEFCAASCGGGP